MQDPKSGDMLPMDSEQDELRLQAEQQGYCILMVGETVDIKGGTFKIHNFTPSSVLLECPKNIFDLQIKHGEELTVKRGRFKVEHYGPMFMRLKGLPGNGIINQFVIDEYHKQEIEKLQKEKKGTE